MTLPQDPSYIFSRDKFDLMVDQVAESKPIFKNPAEMREVICERIKQWPTQPGVYLMRDMANRILYVGKAKNLRNRIRTYFHNTDALTPKTRLLVKRVAEVEFTVTNTELEALLLECNLIKKHRPRYNVRLKDDKNYPYVVLDFTHPFPQFRITRRVIPSPNLKYFGPFSGSVIEIGRFLLKTFQLRDCSDSKFKNRSRPCLNYEIGTCTAPCVNFVTEEQYAKQIREALLFLRGKKKELLESLTGEMKEASDQLNYERAKVIRDKIRALKTMTEKQNAVLTEQQKDIDVIGLHVGKQEIQWVVMFVRSGFLTGRRAERTPIILDSVEETTRAFVEQFYTLSLIPDEVWMMNDFPDRETIETFLSERAGKPVKIGIKRGEKGVRLLGMAHENARLMYQDRENKVGRSPSEMLQEVLGLADTPHSIEGIDVSNFQGELPAVACVHFADERPLKSRYRIYYPKTITGPNDFGMIYETMQRRLTNAENPPPDLFLIDGGKGQLSAAVKAMEELKLEIPICALAKGRTESAFTRKEIKKTDERIFVPNRKNPIVLREGHPALQLLQNVRDEAHRFSVKSHRARRKKATFKESPLLDIRGIGEKTREKLLKTFGSIHAIQTASIEELKTAGLTEGVAIAVKEALEQGAGGEE